MSEIKNDGLHQYGAEPFEQQQIGTAGVEGVKVKQKRSIAVSGNHLTATRNHMPYMITQCYLPPGSGDFPALPQPRLVLDLARDARLSWPRWWLQFPRQFTRQRRSPVSEINNQAVLWSGGELSTLES